MTPLIINPSISKRAFQNKGYFPQPFLEIGDGQGKIVDCSRYRFLKRKYHVQIHQSITVLKQGDSLFFSPSFFM